MEALSLEVMAERLRNLDARTRSNHDSLAKAREKQGKQGETLVEIRGELKSQSDDITEMKDQLKWVLRGLVGATLTFTGLIVTIVVAIFAHG